MNLDSSYPLSDKKVAASSGYTNKNYLLSDKSDSNFCQVKVETTALYSSVNESYILVYNLTNYKQ